MLHTVDETHFTHKYHWNLETLPSYFERQRSTKTMSLGSDILTAWFIKRPFPNKNNMNLTKESVVLSPEVPQTA